MYESSKKALLTNMQGRVRRLAFSLSALEDKNSDYANDHVLLINMYSDVIEAITKHDRTDEAAT